MSKSLIFYTNPMSRGQIVRWMLEESGADYEQQLINYGEQIKSPEYLAINPMGKVPAIKHGDYVVTECAAICAYLAAAFPDANLAPKPDQLADYYRWLFFASGPLESAIINNAMGFNVDAEQQRMAGYGTYETTIRTLDQWFADNDYVCGNTFTAADVYVGAQIDWGMMFKTVTETDNFNAYAERLRSRPAYLKAKEIDAELAAKM
ncbi:MAG: glutathione S-transferase N-terminal domain-containing protein [Acidiferrobacterales bacterium]|nr:glutathione S-transferase N-terminal domain-containing protein [Acidiferrobacterales bacterium]